LLDHYWAGDQLELRLRVTAAGTEEHVEQVLQGLRGLNNASSTWRGGVVGCLSGFSGALSSIAEDWIAFSPSRLPFWSPPRNDVGLLDLVVQWDGWQEPMMRPDSPAVLGWLESLQLLLPPGSATRTVMIVPHPAGARITLQVNRIIPSVVGDVMALPTDEDFLAEATDRFKDSVGNSSAVARVRQVLPKTLANVTSVFIAVPVSSETMEETFLQAMRSSLGLQLLAIQFAIAADVDPDEVEVDRVRFVARGLGRALSGEQLLEVVFLSVAPNLPSTVSVGGSESAVANSVMNGVRAAVVEGLTEMVPEESQPEVAEVRSKLFEEWKVVQKEVLQQSVNDSAPKFILLLCMAAIVIPGILAVGAGCGRQQREKKQLTDVVHSTSSRGHVHGSTAERKHTDATRMLPRSSKPSHCGSLVEGMPVLRMDE